jgi:hypothetical protein
MESKEKIKVSLDNYISDEYSICREERQYALYLYNILKKYGGKNRPKDAEDLNKIFSICKIPKEAIIENVFYEATFMRDIFERDRRIRKLEYRNKANENNKKYNAEVECERAIFSKKYVISECDDKSNVKYESFNQKLLQYLGICEENAKKASDKNIGHNKFDKIFRGKLSQSSYKKEMTMAQYMMNSKPDIAVIYRLKNEKDFYLLFLECKFESYEDTQHIGEEKVSQSYIQYKIADFIFKKYGTYRDKKLKVDETMEKNKSSVLVKFTRKEEEREINIKELILLNNKIFMHEE